MHKRVRKVRQPQWLTRDILDQLSKRDTLLKKARACNTADAWAQYRGARNQATNMIIRAKRNYFKASFQNSKGNSKSIWKLIRSLGGDRPTRQSEFFKVTEEDISSGRYRGLLISISTLQLLRIKRNNPSWPLTVVILINLNSLLAKSYLQNHNSLYLQLQLTW